MIEPSAVLKLCFVLLLCQHCSAAIEAPRTTKDYPCPLDADIAPCVCTFSADYIEYYMDCSAVRDQEELANAFTALFPFTTFVSLTIDQTACTECELTALPAGSLGSAVSFITIDITGTKVETVDEGVFTASHDTLTTLSLDNNLIESFPFESLGEFTVLSSLSLNTNQFDERTPIPDITSSSIETINLNNNPALIIQPSFVTNCPLIRGLHLRNGKLPAIPVFDESPVNMFTGLQDISYLDFSRNSIDEIISNTVVAEDKSLTHVDFSHNNISILHPGCISGFDRTQATTLLLQNNAIVRLDQEVWQDLLTELPGESSVDISENPLLCGCEIAWLVLDDVWKLSLTDTTTCGPDGPAVKNLPDDLYLDC